jgi:hypothetical protein
MQRKLSRLLLTPVIAASLAGAATAEGTPPLESATASSEAAATVVVQSGSAVGAGHPAPSKTIVVQPGQTVSVQPGQVVVLVVQPTPTVTNPPSSSREGNTPAAGDAPHSRPFEPFDREDLR